MRSRAAWTTKPSGQSFTLNRGSPLAAGLRFYIPFTDGAGRRWTELVSGKGPNAFSGSSAYALSGWSVGQPGIYFNCPENRNVEYNQYRVGAGALSQMTIGGLMMVQPGGAVQGGAGRPFIGFSGSPLAMSMSSIAHIDQHFRVDFISNTNYFRSTTALYTAGEIRTFFATFTSGVNPRGFTAKWPQGAITEITYNDRGAAAGTSTLDNMSVLSFDSSGNSYGPSAAWWLGIWDRVLRLEEMQALHDAPWQLIRRPYLDRATENVSAAVFAARVQHTGHPALRAF